MPASDHDAPPAPRRPLPATGRQDRHRPPRPARPAAEPAAELPLQDEAEYRLPPRGADYYARSRAGSVRLGLAVALFAGFLLVALVLLGLAFRPSTDSMAVPAGSAGEASSEEE